MYKLFLVVVNHIRLRVWATAIVSWSKQNHRRRPDYRSTVKRNRVSKKWSRRRLTRRAAGWERQCHGWRGRFRRPSPPPWDAPAMSWWALSAVGRRGGDSIWVRRRRRKTDGRSLHKDGTTTASWKAGGIAGSFAPSSPFLPALSCLVARPRAMRMYLRDANPKPDIGSLMYWIRIQVAHLYPTCSHRKPIPLILWEPLIPPSIVDQSDSRDVVFPTAASLIPSPADGRFSAKKRTLILLIASILRYFRVVHRLLFSVRDL